MTNPPVSTREYLKPPITEVGVIGWLRGNLFNSWFNSLLTIAVLLLLWQTRAAIFQLGVHRQRLEHSGRGLSRHRRRLLVDHPAKYQFYHLRLLP